MASRLNPYLQFAGTARRAMAHYRDVFGGTLEVTTFGDFGEQDPAVADLVMHVTLQTPGGFTLMASDVTPGMAEPAAASVMVSGDDEAELRGYWERLCAGAAVTAPLERQVWGDLYGSCTDRFGTQWMVNIEAPG